MRFLTDQDVYAATVRLLGGLGHDVATASQLGLSLAEDAELLRAAGAESRILITRDRDFGGLVFLQGSPAGILYLRMTPSTLDAVHTELERVLTLYSEQKLQQSFVVIEPARHRMRSL